MEKTTYGTRIKVCRYRKETYIDTVPERERERGRERERERKRVRKYKDAKTGREEGVECTLYALY